MKKKLAVLVGMMLLAAASPAFAQQEGPVTATGVLGEPFTVGEDPEPVYPLTDEETGTDYELISGFVDLEPFIGERVTIEGVPVPGVNPRALNVTQIAPADGPPEPSPDRTATLTFELTVEGDPPPDTRFLGFIPAEGGISAPLTDPDGDGVYTGSVSVPKFPPGPVPPDAEPVSLPVQIAQNTGGVIQVIRDFGLVLIDEDKTFEATVSFEEEDAGPNQGVDVNEDGTVDEADREAASSISEAARDAVRASGEPALPVTGGTPLLSLFAGAGLLLLITSGLLMFHRSGH